MKILSTDDSIFTSLTHFKDWTNYLLVTTVAFLGWVAASEDPLSIWFAFSMVFLCASVFFAIFTLALVPLAAEADRNKVTSIYQIAVTAKPFYLWGPERKFYLKYFCWPQHVLFLSLIHI